MINWLKVKAIEAADWVNQHHDPFQDFVRPGEPKTPEFLWQKARRFEDDLCRNFWNPEINIFSYARPAQDWVVEPVGDQALWHGVVTAVWAMKAAVEKDPTGNAQSWLKACVLGLSTQQPGGRLIRAVTKDGNVDDASNDQATGHLLGLAFAYRYGDKDVSNQARLLLDAWALNVLCNGDALIGPDHKPTKFGALTQGWKTDPLRLSLLGALYHTAFTATGNDKYYDACVRLVKTYGRLIEYPKVSLAWWGKNYDTHRAAIHLLLLKASRESVARMRHIVRKDGNIWVNELCRMAGAQDPTDREMALKVLSEFSVEDKMFDTGKVNSTDPRVDKTIWNGEWVSHQPLPRWKVQSQDFFWQRNLHSIDGGDPREQAGFRYSGLDFLAAYWLARLNGTLTAND